MKKLLVIIILFGISGSFYNSISFRHYHITDCGLLIYHSHPLHDNDETPNNDNHNHTNYEYIVLDQVSKFNNTVWNSSDYFLLIKPIFFDEQSDFSTIKLKNHSSFSTKLLRAPPVI